ncbi:hypothetical protein UT300006_31860 [Clostridium sp. CTA-6]|nr:MULTISPECIES: hypothetical protein [Clostridium]MDS1006867.1 hypothetical protein [Clostridium sporogenes]
MNIKNIIDKYKLLSGLIFIILKIKEGIKVNTKAATPISVK